MDTEGDTAEPADEVYVNEEGDAVLVYDSSGAENGTGEYGFDAAEGLIYTMINSRNVTNESVEGELLVELTSGELTGDGYLKAPAPDGVQDLDVTLDGEQSSTTARMDATLYAVLDSTTTDEVTGGMASEGESVSTQVSVNSTTDRLQTSGSFSAEGQVNDTEDVFFDVSLSGQNGDYTIDATQQQVIAEENTQQWDTEENATRTLEELFNQSAAGLNGTASVNVASYSFDDTTNELDISYTVDISGIERSAIADQINSSNSALNETQESNLADAIYGINMRTVSATVEADSDNNTMSTSFDVDVSNLEPVAYTGFDIAEANAEDENITEMVRGARERYTAASNSNYAQLVDFDADVTDDGQTVTIESNLSYDTENREAYVDELGTTPSTVFYQAAAELEDDDSINTTASLTVQNESLLEDALDGAITSARQDDSSDNNAAELFEAVQAADLQKAKMDVSVQDGNATLQAGGKFNNSTAFNDALGDQFGGETVTHLYGQFDQSSEETYVYVDGLVGPDATESDVRNTSVANDTTDVYMPDEWDPDNENFPELDNQAAADFLGVELESDGSGDDDLVQEDGAGFSVVVAAIALLAAALLARRRD